MKFSVHGPFRLPFHNRLINSAASEKKNFWEVVDSEESNLSEACGCYIFVIRKNSKALPWYIGLTTKRSFKKEVLGLHQINHYNQAIGNARRGWPEVYLLAKRTPGDRFARPSARAQGDIEFLETFMFGVGLNANGKLRNSRNTRFLRAVTVPGIINTPRRAPTTSERALRKDMGL
ncbi:hypothetical protein [Dyella sp.]|uniref:hypothetical protein n=1 Tax=Dyella sp. TaxID=1869338 RepID=UPI002FD960C0